MVDNIYIYVYRISHLEMWLCVMTPGTLIFPTEHALNRLPAGSTYQGLGLREEHLYSLTLCFHLSQSNEVHTRLTWFRSMDLWICDIHWMIRPFLSEVSSWWSTYGCTDAMQHCSAYKEAYIIQHGWSFTPPC